ncbi:hypothetical protein [Yoonia maritima]|uniref:hypothetical protein n=1 Tax=Yoonia maritima TaxID=1435347 RepID=UPI0013A63AE7|nr:hypothetical protein [Yoonia maritima]
MPQRSDIVKESSMSVRRGLLGEGRFALGLVSGLCVALLVWFLSSLSEERLSIQNVLQIAPAAGALFVALASLLISYLVLSENRLMRQAGTDPVILVHLGKRDDAPMLTTIEVRNVGAGAAMDVSVKVLNGAPAPESRRVVIDLEKLDHPIRAIPQSHSVSYNFGAGFNLLGADKYEPLEPITLQITYENIEGTVYSSQQIIDVRELRFQQAHTPNETKVAKSLESISKDLGNLLSHQKSIAVITETKAEHDESQERFRDETRKLFKNEEN